MNLNDIYQRMDRILKRKNRQTIQERYKEISHPENLARVIKRYENNMPLNSEPTDFG